MANKFITALFGDYSKKEVKRLGKTKQKVLDLEEKYQAMDDKELTAQTAVLKTRLADGETLDDILPDAFAVCREAAWRVLGMKHFPVQIVGGIVLHQGRIAEMKTYAQPQEPVQLAHPLGVTLGQVVVDGDNVYAAAGQRVQISG